MKEHGTIGLLGADLAMAFVAFVVRARELGTLLCWLGTTLDFLIILREGGNLAFHLEKKL